MKKTFLMIVALLICGAMYGQRTAQVTVTPKKNAFYLGLKAGLDLTTMTQPSQGNLYDKMGTGFSAGIVGKARFNSASPNAPAGTGILGVGLELKYKLNNVKTFAVNDEGKQDAGLSLGYFEVPVYLQLFPFYKSDAMNTFYIEAGPDFAFLASKNPKTLTLTSKNGTQTIYNIDKLKGTDVRVLVGLGYDFPIKNSNNQISNLIGLNARYYIGTTNLNQTLTSKMSTFELSLSWMFSLGRL